ncbi:LEF-6 [Clanis bilineata nucleopolyhedrovirus]|uniref:LEF-6 n=1 Tax=Clanis bilineata nucleopolyhedrovirus TaxID=1307957 RepID=Q0N481_9ABAC|nr:LEF-6 [Clanis bilineata nucleopolyhedrovirus]ABF47362.1 LEF-6 [Clanis bilineata nucleopolyhedrovirus]
MYAFSINGGDVQKRFAHKFIDYICKNTIKDYIISDQCTRKQIVVSTKYAASQLMRANKNYFWPNGRRFKCSPIPLTKQRLRFNVGDGDDCRRRLRSRPRQLLSETNRRAHVTNRKSSGETCKPHRRDHDYDHRINTTNTIDNDCEDWGTVVDVELCEENEFDDNDNDLYHQRQQHVNQQPLFNVENSIKHLII